MAPGRAIDETDPIRVSALFVAIIVITLLFEKFTHWLEHSLKGKTRRGLRHAIHYIEEEILALGLISLLLIVFEEYLIKLCVDGTYGGGYDSGYDSGYSSDSYPSDDYPSDNYPSDEYEDEGDRKRFFFRKLLAGYGDDCPEGEEPFWSANTIHQTHYFIFLVAVIHMLYASAAIVICLLRMRRWKQFEQRPSRELQQLKNTNLVYGKNAFEYWFWSFWAQFSPSVDESLYLSLRALFIERMEFPDDFDFLSFVVNTLTEEFAIVVRCDWVMWAVAAIWILVPAFLLVTTILAVLIVLLAGTKLEMIGVKLTQLAFLAYGQRGNALLKPIKAPTNLLHRSTTRSNVPQRKMSHLGLLENQELGPRLSTKSMSVHGGKHGHTGSDELRRVSSFEVDKNFSFSAMSTPRQAMYTPRNGGTPSELREIVTPSDQAVQAEGNNADAKYQEGRPMPAWMSCCGFFDTRKKTRANFSKHYNLPDSANLFWFQQPQLILKALRFVYFETSMAVAVVCFDIWQDSDFILEDTDFFHSRWVTVGALIAVGVLCLLHTSFLMLPTYALTMVAGSHCPERILKVAKKMDIETAELTRIESLREKSIKTQIQNLTAPPDLAKKSANPKELTLFDDHNEKAITSLVGAMYRGRLQRLVRKTSADSQAISEHINLQRKSTNKSMEFPFDAEGAASTDRAGQSSHSSGVDSDEMKGIEAIFGSFEKFLEHVKHAQESIWAMNPSAVFNFDCNTGTYNGESTPFDRAAINLTWDMLAAKQDTANDDNEEKNGGTKQG